MNIEELKNSIENKDISNSFMIWKVKDESSYIIANQYYNLIADIFGLEIKYIESINDIQDESFVKDDNLYIINTTEWASKDEHENCIVICNKTKDSRAIELPQLEEWQVIDYCIPKVAGLEKLEIENLISRYNKNFYRFINDIGLISIFNKSEQKFIFEQLNKDDYFLDLSNYKIWDLSNAIIKRDVNSIKNILKVIDFIDVEPLGLAKVLYSNFKTIASIQMNPNITYKDLDISEKQFFVIKKYNCWYYTNEELIEILSLLTNIESLYKYNGITINNLIDYIIINILKG